MKTRSIIVTLTAVAAASMGGCGGPTQAGLDARTDARDRINAFTAQFTYDQARQDYRSGQLERALRNVNAAIGESPDIPEYWLLQGQIYLEMNDLEEAMSSLETAIGLDEKLAEAHYFAGIILQRWSDDEPAYQHYLRAYEAEPDRVHYLMATAEALIALGEFDAARAIVLEKLTYFEHNAALRHLLGQISLLEGDPTTAARLYEESLLLNPENVPLLEELAWVQYDAGLYGKCYESVIELKQRSEVKRFDLLHLEARCLVILGRARDAHEAYRELVRERPASEALWIEFGTLAWKVGDYRRLAECSVRTIDIAPERFEGYMLKGVYERNRGRTDDAIALLSEAAGRATTSPVPHLLLGRTLEQVGRMREAYDAYGSALTIDPDNAEARSMRTAVEQKMHIATVETDADADME